MFWTKFKGVIQSGHQQIFQISPLVKVFPQKILWNSLYNHVLVILLWVEIVLLKTDSFLLIFRRFSVFKRTMTSCVVRCNIQIVSQVRHQSLLSLQWLTLLGFMFFFINNSSLLPFDVYFEFTLLNSAIHSHLRLLKILNSSTDEI